jgi:hypothetical protein
LLEGTFRQSLRHRLVEWLRVRRSPEHFLHYTVRRFAPPPTVFVRDVTIFAGCRLG